jgi:glycosyltransferase involved in cell wall biosynthesis
LVADRLPEFQLDLIGDGPARAQVVGLLNELRLEKIVHLRGTRDDVPAWLAEADMFLLSSVSEGICLTVLEAMAAGLPVIATDVGGNREIVDDGKTGRLVPARNPEAMATAIIAMCENTLLSREMGRLGHELVLSRFNVRTMVAQYETMYHELLGRECGTPSNLGNALDTHSATINGPEELAQITT